MIHLHKDKKPKLNCDFNYLLFIKFMCIACK